MYVVIDFRLLESFWQLESINHLDVIIRFIGWTGKSVNFQTRTLIQSNLPKASPAWFLERNRWQESKQQFFTFGCVNLQQKKPVCFSSMISILLIIYIITATSKISWYWFFNTHHAVNYCAYKFRVSLRFFYIWSVLTGISSHLFQLQYHLSSVFCFVQAWDLLDYFVCKLINAAGIVQF